MIKCGLDIISDGRVLLKIIECKELLAIQIQIHKKFRLSKWSLMEGEYSQIKWVKDCSYAIKGFDEESHVNRQHRNINTDSFQILKNVLLKECPNTLKMSF